MLRFNILVMKSHNIQFVILLALLLGRMLAVAQTGTGHYLHWNSARCGSVAEMQTLLLQGRPFAALHTLAKQRAQYLPLLNELAYPDLDHPYLRDTYRLPALARGLALPWSGDTCVDFHEPIPVPMFCGMPNDPGLSGLLGSVQSELPFVRVPEAWERVALPAPVRIGVVDTWADTSHPDLRGQFASVHTYSSGIAHGTAVSGIAGAITNNELGIASASHGAELAIAYATDIDGAVVKLAREGARVIAVPWINRCFYSPLQQILYDQARNYGALVVASAGNGDPSAGCGDGHALAYPASLGGVLSVSSVGHRFARGSVDSVLGPWHWRDVHDLFPLGDTPITHTHNDSVDLVAPGHGLLTTVPGGGYAEAWGTSFTAPLVAGIAALVWSANPCLTPGEVMTILKTTAYQVDTLPENSPYAGGLGSGRVDALAAVEAALGRDSVVLYSGDDLLWTGTQRVGRSLVLEAGARLTIRGKVYFGPGAKVVLKRGARLELDGAELLVGCGGQWGGIRVLGNPALPHPPPGFLTGGAYPATDDEHALLVIRPGSVLRDADTAVLSWNGGLVGGEGAVWLDNTVAFSMENYSFPVRSFLRNCSFVWEDREPAEGVSMTRLRHVPGFLFQGCSWRSAFSKPGLRAIEAAEAGLTLKAGTCPGSPCLIGPKGEIRGFDLGLEVWSAYGISPGPLVLEHTAFRQCRRSVLLRGLDGAVLQSLDVEVPAAGALSWQIATYGLHLEACRNTRIAASTFVGLGGFSLGVLAYAGEFYPAELRSCRFSGLLAGLVVLGPNGNARSGLQVSCNRFSGNTADVWLAPGHEAASIARYQSDCVYQPAGNRFDGASTGPHWLLDSGAAPAWYFHQSNPEFIPVVSDPLLLRSVDCGRSFQASDCPILPVLPLNQAVDSIRALALLVEQLEATFDNGSTEALLRVIAAPGVGAGVMQFALSEANPYLSDTVLLALIDRYPAVTPGFFQFILESNSPLSERVLQQALLALPTGVHEELMAFQSLAPNTREQLRARIASVRKRLYRWEARRFVSGWETGSWDSLLLYAADDPDRLARLLTADEQWANLDLLLRVGSGDTLDRSAVLDILLQVAAEGRTLQALSLPEIMQLETLAAEPGAVGVAAALVLRSYDGRIAEEPLPIDGPLFVSSLRLSEDAAPRLLASPGAAGASSVFEDLPQVGNGFHTAQAFRLFPNPVRDWLALRGISNQGTWQILDARGIPFNQGSLSPVLDIPVAELPPGLYTFRMEPEGAVPKVQTFVKIP
ncbi:MAG: S8 family serine peptidase [Bacteroidetes bacterium]|nr:S8 family serine peptidase [Bacteroidota bacterium]